ncbi:MAG: DEAD/DEAH box helicase [Solobacterium sp.]|nr:DEAD/DEAH box helicase [Solobacterium sp.]
MNQILNVNGNDYDLKETVPYPNGGISYFYTRADIAIIVDQNICLTDDGTVFSYSLITDKQNMYMKEYTKVFRFLIEDIEKIGETVQQSYNSGEVVRSLDRADNADASPLELLFEKNFTNVYGMSALKYLNKEFSVQDNKGHTYFLDYYIRKSTGDIAVEENGISFHHPQIIGAERYRRQLNKQNTCTQWGIKLYRFSTEDCKFIERIEDDIVSYFGRDTKDFIEHGILADRSFKLYEHQEITLEEMQKQREKGVKTFLIVYPTASGKSRIAEEDLKRVLSTDNKARALILAPNNVIVQDWQNRISMDFPEMNNRITISTYAKMMIHYTEYSQDYYSYIIVDEAHHAVAPVLKRVVQYFTPDFLVGLTATDKRPDKKKLESVFGTYTTGLSLSEAMEKGIVARANVYRIETNLDLSKVRFNGKDYINADLEKSIRVTSRNELIASVLKDYFCGGLMEEKQGVIFCVNTTHAKEVAEELQKVGISAKAYTRKEKNTDRIMQDFREHKIRFLCACEMISEGWDYPELGILVMARPTLSKVLYLQQIGRGLRKTDTKKNVFVIDVVDEYGTTAIPCTMHSIFNNYLYVPFGDILRRDYQEGDIIEIDGLKERVERIVEVNVDNYEDKYGDYLNSEQLAREYYLNTSTIINWIRKNRIHPDVSFPFGNRTIYMFSPDSVQKIRKDNNIAIHNETTIYKDFFDFLQERDYSLSYKMPFLLSLIKHMNNIGDANIDEVLDDYISFYQDRIDRGLIVDRKTCPYNSETLKNRKMIKDSMLTNPFEKFERKRFMYYSQNLNMISLNHALFKQLTKEDYNTIRKQMYEDLNNYYAKLESQDK